MLVCPSMSFHERTASSWSAQPCWRATTRGRVSVRSVLELLTAVYALNPMFGEAEVVEIGTGVRPAFLDNLPRIRWRDGVLHVNGFFRHGFLLAPALARMAADVLLKRRGSRR